MDELKRASIREIAQKIRAKEVSPIELIEAHLTRIAKMQPKLNAFVHVDEEGARERAREAESAVMRGEELGALHGVPLSVKSCIDVAGWPCPAGSLLRKNEVPSANAPMVQRLVDAGAILLGNTNTPEFLMAYETDNRVSGKTSNPWNTGYSSGGSSGGEAAAIAAGLSAGGIGSDGGGSIRVPAHFCGICGLKPTPGRIPGTGHFPPGSSAFGWIGVCGPMARTIGDVRAFFSVMAGPEAYDALTAPISAEATTTKTTRGMRIGVLQSDAFPRVTPETEAAVEKAARLLAEQGFVVEEFRLENMQRMLELWWFFFGTVIGELFQGVVSGREDLLSPIFREYLEVSRANGPMKMEEFVTKCAARDHERGSVLKAMENVPVLLSPVCAGAAFRHGEGNWKPGTGYRETMRHAQWLNLTGFPGISLPMEESAEGLPIGVQLIGRPYEEELLLDVAERLEEARGPWQAPAGV
jgi:Asp-tRNA(Asn)/Glu-tRNA(Gln) amidotransferase A subunit family amidase